MRTLVATTDVAGAAAPTVRPEWMERIEAAAAGTLSAKRHHACTTAWRAWSAWCASEVVEPLPARPVLVHAIIHEHGFRGAIARRAPPECAGACAGSPSGQASEGRTPRQAAALTAEALSTVCATAHRPRTNPGGRTRSAERARRRGEMDVAIIAEMRDALPRRSEAAILTWTDAEICRRPQRRQPTPGGQAPWRRRRADSRDADARIPGCIQHAGAVRRRRCPHERVALAGRATGRRRRRMPRCTLEATSPTGPLPQKREGVVLAPPL